MAVGKQEDDSKDSKDSKDSRCAAPLSPIPSHDTWQPTLSPPVPSCAFTRQSR